MGIAWLSLQGDLIMTTLFVGNLSWGTDSSSLSTSLAKYGSVTSCDTGDVRNGRTRGWAIVEMQDAEQANYVIQALNGVEFDGRPLNIRHDQKPEKPQGGGGGRGGGGRAARGGDQGDPSLVGKPENSSGLQVVVRNLPWSVTSEMLRNTFEQIGSVTGADVVCYEDSARSKGWGTVRFSNAEEANDAVARFGGVELAGRPMVIL